jgi:hypothetical protein
MNVNKILKTCIITMLLLFAVIAISNNVQAVQIRPEPLSRNTNEWKPISLSNRCGFLGRWMVILFRTWV